MLVVADAKARSSPHPPLPCRRIIFTVLDHAASGAGGRRPQKEPGVEQGQPNFTLPQTSHLPEFPALPVVPALELPLAVALVDTPHPTPRPRAARYVLVSATSVLVLTEGPPVAQAAFAPSNIKFPASRTKFSLLKSFSNPLQESRPGGPDVDSAWFGTC